MKKLCLTGPTFNLSGAMSGGSGYFRISRNDGISTAAIAMGETYDPLVLAKLYVRGLHADQAKATSWYLKAEQLGAPAAKPQLDAPAAKLQIDAAPIKPSLYQSLNAPFRDCSFCPEMIPVRGGGFLMGSGGDPTEKPVHHVAITSFTLSRFPVTGKEWRQCIEAKVCSDQPMGEDDTPIRNVSWDDAQQYVAWLAQVTHQKYRLPTEAEWEFAARAQSKTKYWWVKPS